MTEEEKIHYMTLRERFLAGHIFSFSDKIGGLPEFKYIPPIHVEVRPCLYLKDPESGQFIDYCWLFEIGQETFHIHFRLFGIHKIDQVVPFSELNFKDIWYDPISKKWARSVYQESISGKEKRVLFNKQSQ